MNSAMGKIDRHIEGTHISSIKGEGGTCTTIWFNLLITYSKIYLSNTLSLPDQGHQTDHHGKQWSISCSAGSP